MKKVALFFLLHILLFGCQTNKDVYKEFIKKYPYYSSNKFTNWETQKGIWWTDYFLFNEDTTEYLSFSKCIKTMDTHKKGDFVFNEFLTKVKKGDSVLVKSYNEFNKLNYSYMRINDKYFFISGKYYYYYKFKLGQLNIYQQKYFEENTDSLVNNLVNEIPIFNKRGKILKKQSQ